MSRRPGLIFFVVVVVVVVVVVIWANDRDEEDGNAVGEANEPEKVFLSFMALVIDEFPSRYP